VDFFRTVDGADVRRGHAVREIDVTAFQHQAQRLRFGHVPHHHALELGSTAPITVEPGQQQRVIRRPFAQHKGPAAGLVGHQPVSPEVSVFLMRQRCFAIDHHRARRDRQRVDQQQRIHGLRQVDDQRMGIAGTDQ
jgi:hypothetical protein